MRSGERWLEALEHSQLLLRVRPCEKPSPLVVVNEKDARVEVGEADGRPPSTPTLQFDQVFWDDQQELFARLQPALLSCIGGASCTVLAHGGPQSGKSYTLSGLFTSGETHGVAPRAIQAITEELERLTTPVPSVDASFFELQQVSDAKKRTLAHVEP
ncbi:Kinesin-like protein KIFC2 [Durusdinium trenchii]|uniref:Kinesin-like protein KIFC2 n=1 Tax=Durusdinium trenchii TaxID=1381693 RepID=A0ABP0HZH9_9DINO